MAFQAGLGTGIRDVLGFDLSQFLLKGNGPAFAIWVGAGIRTVDTGGYIWGKSRETRVARKLRCMDIIWTLYCIAFLLH